MRKVLLNISLSFVLLFSFFNADCQDYDAIQLLNDDEIMFKYNLFEADKCFLEHNFELSENYYQFCLNYQPENAFILYRLATISFQNKDLSQAVSYIDKCLAYNDTNVWYLYLAGTIYENSNLTDKAVAVFNKLIVNQPKVVDFYVCLADVYIQANRYKEAIKVYDQIEKKFGIDETILIQKKNLYLKLKDKKKAEFELKKLADAFPEEPHFKLILADFYQQINDIKSAISIYQSVLAKYPNNGYSHLGLAGCYQILNDEKNFYNELVSSFKSSDIECEVKVGILVDLIHDIKNYSREDFDKVMKLSELLIFYYPEDPDANTIYANFQVNLGNIDIARTALLKVIEIRKDRYAVWQQLILIEHQMNDWISLFKHTSEAIEYFPNQPLLYLINGLSGFQLSKFEQAKKSLELGYSILPKSDPMRAEYLTYLGEINYKLDNKVEAYKYFDKVIELEPENVMVLNNYSYYLSLDKDNLDKALEMSKITITREPDNPTYLDTYAWILFEKQKYLEALRYIEKAVNLDITHSDVIIEHYGDILYFNDDIDNAIEQWKRARTIGNGSGKLDEKIENQKYID